MAIMETDRQGRIVLGKTYLNHGTYNVTRTGGVITLTPVVVYPVIDFDDAFEGYTEDEKDEIASNLKAVGEQKKAGQRVPGLRASTPEELHALVWGEEA